MRNPEARAALVQSLVLDALVVGGVAAQGVGIYMQAGIGYALLVVGTEVALLGVIGAARA